MLNSRGFCFQSQLVAIVQKSNDDIIKDISSAVPDCQIVEIDGIANESLQSFLFAEKIIDSSLPLLISNSFDTFLGAVDSICDALSSTSDGFCLSSLLTTGEFISFWRRGSDFWKILSLATLNTNVKTEVGLQLVLKEAIATGLKIDSRRYSERTERIHFVTVSRVLENFKKFIM